MNELYLLAIKLPRQLHEKCTQPTIYTALFNICAHTYLSMYRCLYDREKNEGVGLSSYSNSRSMLAEPYILFALCRMYCACSFFCPDLNIFDILFALCRMYCPGRGFVLTFVSLIFCLHFVECIVLVGICPDFCIFNILFALCRMYCPGRGFVLTFVSLIFCLHFVECIVLVGDLS